MNPHLTRIGAVGMLCLTLVSCAVRSSAGQSAGSGGSANSATEPAPYRLPLDAYVPSAEGAMTIARARRHLIQGCLRGFGITWPLPAPTTPDLPLQTDRWPLYVSAKDAAARDFDPSPAQASQLQAIKANDAAWNLLSPEQKAVYVGWDAQGRDRTGARGQQLPEIREYHRKQVPGTGCVGAAQAVLNAGAPAATTSAGDALPRDALGSAMMRLGQLQNQADRTVEVNPNYTALVGTWTTCMAANGHPYATLENARGDDRWAFHRAGPQEIAAATTYAHCLTSVGYLDDVGQWRIEAEQALIRQEAAQLMTIRDTVRATVANARAVLGASAGNG